MRVSKITICAVLFLVVATVSWSANIYVAPGGNNTAPYNSWATAAKDIQVAIDSAQANDTIHIGIGTYGLSVGLVIDKPLTLIGASASNLPVIDGEEKVRCLEASAEISLENLSFVNGKGKGGAGISMTGGTLKNCRITDSTATSYGGGIYCSGGSISLEQCSIEGNNSSNHGGGAYFIENSHVKVVDTTIALNESNKNGGGIVLSKPVKLEISGCYITNNVAKGPSGGMEINGSPEEAKKSVVDTLLAGNTSETGAGGGLRVHGSLGVTIADCIVSNNSAGTMGGGVILHNSSFASVKRCLVAGNQQTVVSTTASDGGGGFNILGGEGCVVENCIIEANSVVTTGGGMYINGYGTTVRNSLIRNNICAGTGSYGGGGVRCRNNTTNILENCTIVGNYSAKFGGGVELQNDNDMLFNCIVYNNTCGQAAYQNYRFPTSNPNPMFIHSCTTPELASENNANVENLLTVDPEFIDSDYRLGGRSPCVDYGINLTWMAAARDLDGHQRINPITGKVDLGCYEFYSRGTAIMIR